MISLSVKKKEIENSTKKKTCSITVPLSNSNDNISSLDSSWKGPLLIGVCKK